MNRFLILAAGLFCLSFNESKAEDNYCTGILIDNVLYEKELLKSDLFKPYELTVDFNTNTLFYMTGRGGKLTTGYLQLDTKKDGKIRGIPVGRSSAVDNTNHVVYLGAKDGLYTYNYNDKTAIKLNITDEPIKYLFFKNNLYYTVHPGMKAFSFVVIDGIKSSIPEFTTYEHFNVEYLGLDEHNNIFFSNNSGLFEYKKDDRSISRLGNYVVNGFATDKDGHLYFSAWSEICKINDNSIEVIFTDDTIHGFAIDADYNIIYAKSENIYRLKRTNKRCE